MSAIRIGWGRREISHEGPISIPGQAYVRLSKGIHDPLYATALVIDGGEKAEEKVCFVSADIISVRHHETLAAMIHEKCPEIPEDAVILNCTHTHTSIRLDKTPAKSPDGADIYPGEKTLAFFLEQASEAAREAWESRKTGGIGYGYGYAVVAHSRRVCYFEDMGRGRLLALAPNGTAIMYGNTNDPLFSHYEAGADHFLNCLFTFDEEKKLTGMVLNVPCPSQTSESMCVLSADYWGDVRDMVAKEFGPDVYVLPQCAAAGDLAPRILHYKKAQERRLNLKYPQYPYRMEECRRDNEPNFNKTLAERLDMAQRIVEGVKDVYGWAKKEIFYDLPVCHLVETVPLKMRKVTEEDVAFCKEKLEAIREVIPDKDDPDYRVAMSRYNSVKGRNTRALERYETQGDDPRWDMRLHVVALGDVAFCTNRFELYMDYMHRIQARSPFIQTFIIQLAGDNVGTYLPTKRGEEGKGYSASIFCNKVGSEGGQQLVEETLRMLNEAKAREEA